MLICCAFAGAGVLHADQDSSSQTATFDYCEDSFRQITYSWLDENGDEHVSNLAEAATEPNQIKAYIKEVFTNRNIPGTIYDPTPSDLLPSSRQNDRKAYYDLDWSDYDISGDNTPYEDGITALLIKVKGYPVAKDATLTLDKAIDYIESIKVMTKRKRVESADPTTSSSGWIFNTEEPLNEFFVITKGKLRYGRNYVAPMKQFPFQGMYEEFSPSDGPVAYNVYAKMKKGNPFVVNHDCGSIIRLCHITVMGPESTSQKYYSSLLFFIPDNRFAKYTSTEDVATIDEEDADDNTSGYTYYNKHYSPYFLFHTVALDSEGVSTPEDRVCQVALNWHTCFDQINPGTTAEELFNIYRVVDGKKVKVDASDISFSQQESSEGTTIDAGGQVHKNSCMVTAFVAEKQEESDRDVEYLVESTLGDTTFPFVESNTIEATIPGYMSMERCQLNIAADAKSEFIFDTEGENDRNLYTHTFSLNNSALLTNPLKATNLKAKSEDSDNIRFTLLRAQSLTASQPSDAVVYGEYEAVNSLTITGSELADDGYTYFYGKYTGSDEEVKCLRAKTHGDDALGDYALVEPVAADNGSIAPLFKDSFSVAVTDDSHPEYYRYKIGSNITTYTSDNEEVTTDSRVMEIHVPHSSLSLAYTPVVAYSDLQADRDNLAVTQRAATYAIEDDVTIESYTLNLNGVTPLAVTRRSQSGAYTQIVATSSTDWTDPVAVTDDSDTQTANLYEDVPASAPLVVVITDQDGNTYGSGRLQTQEASTLQCSVESVWCTQDEDSDTPLYHARLTFAPQPAESSFFESCGYYDIWFAYNSDGKKHSLDDDEYWWGTNPSARQIVAQWPLTDNALTVDFNIDWTLSPTKLITVNFKVRHYPHLIAATAATDSRRRDTSVDQYCVVEKTVGLTPDFDSFVAVPTVGSEASSRVDIYTIQGLKVGSYQGSLSSLNAHTSSLPHGIYVVRAGAKAIRIAR